MFQYLCQLSKRMMDKKYRDKVTDTLQLLEQNGGKVSANFLYSLWGFFNQQLLLCRFSLLTCIWLLNLLDEQSFSVHLQTYTVLV